MEAAVAAWHEEDVRITRFQVLEEPSTTTRGEPDVATSAVPLAETKESLKQRP
eukprot:CAMPEP_0185199472 /NCGR_PEP_ID=MMETSP1140-20130426/45198_1 /TAXON_ID=298111 /ORGANISM="Pavlova sp., Strain CCMP459" /LENGTH=52 /DNA_ID=CAMNT_0027766749 /DNA_START=1 /DNA_END=163 /DNA_ORIENTATION=-